MEQMIINALGTLAFGGGGIGVVAYIYNNQFNKLVTSHQEQVERICLSHEKTTDRNAQAFEAALASRDEQLKRFIDATLKNQNT